MTDSTRYWEIFFEVFEGLPRQGPGCRACAAKALAHCRELPPFPAILDLGCGTGFQTFYLAEITGGNIAAVDKHEPFIRRLEAEALKRGLESRILPMVADMENTGLAPGSFDLVWSEGAFYNFGVEKAVRLCRKPLRMGGYLAFTDAVWKKENPPEEVRTLFAGYPQMGFAKDAAIQIERAGFGMLAHFTLPNDAWWDEFYTPMLEKTAELRAKYIGDAKALDILAKIENEPELHRKYSEFYDYEFFVARLT